MIHVMHQSTTAKRRSRVAYRADYRAPELTSRKARTTIGHIVQTGTHAARTGDYLPNRDEKGERNGKRNPKSDRVRAKANPRMAANTPSQGNE